MDSNYDCGGKPGQPHWTEEPKPGVAAKGEREAFEAWFAEGDGDPEWLETSGANHELYMNADTENMWQAWQARAASDTGEAAEIARLNAIINTPHTDDFLQAVSIEAEHQRQRWGAEGDAGKAPSDWFWLLGYLSGKALTAFVNGDSAKGLHHIISSAAALKNWHMNAIGASTSMRPGIDAARSLSAGGEA